MIEYLDTATKTTFHQIVYGFVMVFAIALFMNGKKLLAHLAGRLGSFSVDPVRVRATFCSESDSWRQQWDRMAWGKDHASRFHAARHASFQRVSECCVSADRPSLIRQGASFWRRRVASSPCRSSFRSVYPCKVNL